MVEVEEDSSPDAAERSLQALLDNMPDLIFFKDIASRFTRANHAFAAYVGLADPGEVVGKSDADFFPPVEAREFLADEHHLLTTGEALIGKPEANRGPDGQTRWVLTTKVPIRDGDGQITGLVGIARDITERKVAEEALRQSEALFRSLIQNALDIITIVNADGTVRYASPAIERVLGYQPEELVGSHGFDLVHLDDQPAVDAAFLAPLGDPALTPTVEFRFRHKDGSWRWIEATGMYLLDDPAVSGLVVNSRDITERKHADEVLLQSESRFRALVQHAADVIVVLGADGTRNYISPSVERVLGYRPEELIGAKLSDLRHPDDEALAAHFFADVVAHPGQHRTAEWRVGRRDGSWGWFEVTATNLLTDPSVGGIVVNAREITERKEAEERLWYQAHHDPLTGLPNRTLFMDRLKQAVSTQGAGSVAVLFLDLDGFKVVNDSLGHECGDRLLAAVSKRFASRLRSSDLLARFGGDEFTVLHEHIADAREVTRIANRLLAALADPFTLDGHELVITASIGVALSSPKLITHTDLLRAVDVALYRAKTTGKNKSAVFDATRDASAFEQLDRETALRRALERGELRLHYQPKVELASGRLLGVEALVRWQHPTAGLLPPAAFIPLAEETELIVPLGVWVLGEACRQAVAWQEQFPHAATLGMCVNVSPIQVRHPGLAGQVERILRETGLPPERLTVEITERGLVEDTDATDRTVEALRALGVRLAIDDFGAYQAGLGYLRRWPMDVLKLDRSLVTDIDQDERSRTIVAAVVGLARTLGMEATGEGIETDEQLAQLRELGCAWGQGYYFARPLPPEELVAFLEKGPVCCLP